MTHELNKSLNKFDVAMFAWHSRCLKGNRKKKPVLLFIELSESQQNDSNPENIEVYSHPNIEPMSHILRDSLMSLVCT